MWQVTYTDEFQAWWDTLDLAEQESILASVELLQSYGPSLGRPHVDMIRGSRHGNMKGCALSTREGRIGRSSRSTRSGWRCY